MVEDIGQQAEIHIEQQFFKRLSRLPQVRRFVISWILLLVLAVGGVVAQTRALSHYYQQLSPVEGGTYTEGIIGAFTNANPLYATNSADSAVSHLIFAGLFKYDNRNRLVGDLAESWKVDEKELTYTIVLKPRLVWQDGSPLTSEDVVFTYKTIQNPDAQSALESAWKGVTVAAVDARTVTFTLPAPLTSFPYSMTNGIVPKHLLDKIPATELRSASFNTAQPVGAGPFSWRSIQVNGDKPEDRQEQVELVANSTYYMGPPKLERFVVHTYRDEKQMLGAFEDNQLTAMAGLDSLPDTLHEKADIQDYNIPLTSEVMVFFRTDSELLADAKVRQALVRAVNVPELDKKFKYPVLLANEPFLQHQLGYDKTLTQLGFDQAEANKLLDAAGWTTKNADGIRTKADKPLRFQLFSQSTSEYALVTSELQKAWRAVGVDLVVNLQTVGDLQTTVDTHDYDALLYGISIGPDPDVFAYWDSSQADNHLSTRFNFSNYKSTVADKALQAGRTRSDPALRVIKYKPFLEAWRNDAPALALYQPSYLYVTRDTVTNFNPKLMNEPVDRYATVTQWMVRQEKTAK